MVRIVIETQAEGDHPVAVASSAVPASGDDLDGGAGPGGEADLSEAPADSADGGAPPDWLVSAIEAAERGEGPGAPEAKTSDAEDGGAGM